MTGLDAVAAVPRTPIVVSVNVDVEWLDAGRAGEAGLYGRFSYGRYGAREGIWRLLDVFRVEGVKVTFFLSADDGRRHPAIVEAIQSGGHEIAALGSVTAANGAYRDEAEKALAGEREVLAALTGRPPKGWRASNGLMKVRTLRELARLGYLYDSSAQDDDWPYVMSDNDTELVELPIAEYLKDSTFYAGCHTHERVRKVWREEFHAIYAEGGYVPLTLHARGDHGSGRADRARVVADFLNDATRFPGVSVMPCSELAELWRSRGDKRDTFLDEIKEPRASSLDPSAASA